MFSNPGKRFHFCLFSPGPELSSVPLGTETFLYGSWLVSCPVSFRKNFQHRLHVTVERGNTFLIESGCPISPEPNTPLDCCHMLKIPLSEKLIFFIPPKISDLNCVKPKRNGRYHLRLKPSHISD